jgi:hypothetical protein
MPIASVVGIVMLPPCLRRSLSLQCTVCLTPSNVSIKDQERVKITTPLAGMTTLAE